MNLGQRKEAFVKCGLFINRHFSENWEEYEKNLHEGLQALINTAHKYNNWFIPEFIE